MIGRRAAWAVAASACAMGVAHAAWPPPRSLPMDRLAAAGVRVVESRHATLVTDLASFEEIDALAELVDIAVPQWAERFGVPRDRVEGWRLRVHLIEDEERFRSLGLWPEVSSEFPHGLSLGYEVWLREQPTAYYRRCLLLHEATHSFMATLLGGCGPGWHMEGVAELCGAHQWDAATGDLRMGVVPASREASPQWGRVRLVRDAVTEGRLLPIDAVMRIDNRRVLSAESYAWVWALAKFFDTHPRYVERFRGMAGEVTRADFNDRFRAALADERPLLDAEWQWFAETLAYRHDVEREAIDPRRAALLSPGESQTVTIAADRGWQATGVRLEPDEAVRIAASGRFTIAREPDGGAPWPCEAGGVTLAWHDGQPVGRLMAVVLAPDGLTEPRPIGRSGELRSAAGGDLLLRVNDSPGSLAENAGELRVVVRRTDE